MRLLAIWLLIAFSGSAQADFIGRVVRIHDGDTLTVLVDQQQIRVRLESIDAPELKQAFGRRSKESLGQLCGLGWETCGGVDANREQVRRGMAWVFKRYAPTNSPLYQLQHEAQGMRRGLWNDPRPVAPWDWRARRAPAKAI
jgi:endonuclease YncB( thermonuclease family)